MTDITFALRVYGTRPTNTVTVGSTTLTHVVDRVYWKYTASKDGKEACYFGETAVDITNIDPETYINFTDMTETILTNWVTSRLSEEYISLLKKHTTLLLEEVI